MLIFKRFALSLSVSGFLASPAAFADTLTYVTNFTKNADAQQSLFAGFPTGIFTTSDTTFDITSSGGNDYYDPIHNGGSPVLDIQVNIPDPTTIFTLINGEYPSPGPIGSLTFVGSRGAMQTFVLSADPNAPGGADVRDFYQGSYNNTLNAVNAMNVFTATGQGGAATFNVSNGLSGTYVLDEQRFALSAAFADQSLTDIILSTQPSSGGTPFLYGATVASGAGVSTVPLPASAPMFGIALAALGAAGYRLKRKGRATTA